MWHREPHRGTRQGIPTVPLNLFREHLTALGELGRLPHVPLGTLLNEPGDGGEPLRFALTFDDDYATHAREVLPVLRGLNLHVAFFLSGRAFQRLGGYWLQRLEALVAERGVGATAALLEFTDIHEEAELTLRCEGDLRRQDLIERTAPPGDAPLSRQGIRQLADAGMTIGFHTLHHPVLPALNDDAIHEALMDGRNDLASLVGAPLEWLAYPHGKADGRTIDCTRVAGYGAAWTTAPRLGRCDDNRYELGRWEPLPAPGEDLVIRLGDFLKRERVRRDDDIPEHVP